MAISIDHLTYVISVPKADLTLTQASPEVRELNINTFRLWLKDWEDGSEGIHMPDTHRHNTESVLSGLTYARIVEVLSPYTIEFEDGQYTVNCVGANHNISDKKVANQVSLIINNAAGLISNAAIEFSSYNGRVTLDPENSTGRAVSGTIFPTGTLQVPVDNLADALLIATTRGLQVLNLLSGLTITTGSNIDNYTIRSDFWPVVTVETGVSQENTVYDRLSLYGEMGAYWNVLIDCWVYDITEFSGWMRGGSFESIALSEYTALGGDFGGLSYFDDVVPMYPNVSAIITSNTDVQVSFTNCKEIVTLMSAAAGAEYVFGLGEGKLIVDVSCTGGSIKATGYGEVINNSTVEVDQTELTAENVAAAVGDRVVEGTISTDEALKIILAAISGRTAGIGTTQEKYKSVDGATDRISVDFDANGNRTNVTLNGA